MHEPLENMQDEPEKEWNDAEVNAEVNRARQIERDQMAEYFDREAGQSFAVPAELAGEYTHGTPENMQDDAEMAERLDDERAAELDLWINGPKSPQNSVDPSVPPPRSASVEEIIEATTGASRRLRACIGHYGPHYVTAIAAQLAAELPGMFAGPDVLGPVRVPPPILPGIDEHVVMCSSPHPEQPPVHEPYRYRKPPGSGKPAGSKLARKAARGKL